MERLNPHHSDSLRTCVGEIDAATDGIERLYAERERVDHAALEYGLSVAARLTRTLLAWKGETTATCIECEQPFVAFHSTVKYCSARCRQRAFRRRGRGTSR